MYHQLRESFEKDLSWLLANFQIIKPGEPLCSRSMLLTFDDAYKDVYTRLYPALKKHNISAVVAIPTAFIGSSDRYATWEELREMTASGHLIPASHTVTHPDLTTHPDPESELLISKQTIEEKTGVTPKLFVYPYGKWNPSTQAQVYRYYPQALRIGSAINRSWRPLLYRIDEAKFLRSPHPFRYLPKYYLNRLRFQ